MPRFSSLTIACAALSVTGAVHAASPTLPQQARGVTPVVITPDTGALDMMSSFTSSIVALSPRGAQPVPPCRPTDRPPTNRPPTNGQDCRPSRD